MFYPSSGHPISSFRHHGGLPNAFPFPSLEPLNRGPPREPHRTQRLIEAVRPRAPSSLPSLDLPLPSGRSPRGPQPNGGRNRTLTGLFRTTTNRSPGPRPIGPLELVRLDPFETTGVHRFETTVSAWKRGPLLVPHAAWHAEKRLTPLVCSAAMAYTNNREAWKIHH